jgi:hypothetical protein
LVEGEVVVVIEPPCDGSTLELQIGDQVVSREIADTVGWENYKSFSLVSVQVKAGEVEVLLRPTDCQTGSLATLEQ